MGVVVTILTVIEVIACIFLILVVLLQSGKSAGLSGSIFGGTSDTFLARNKGKSLDAKLAKATKWLAGVFVLLTLVLNFVIK